jgi:hypothetical protein
MWKLPRLTKPKQKINLLIAALFVAVQLPLFMLASGNLTKVSAAAQHCPGATDENSAVNVPVPAGYEIVVDNDNFNPANISGSTLTLEAGTLFCVKAGPQANDSIQTMGATGSYTVTWTVGAGPNPQTPGISYYMTYKLTETDPEVRKGKIEVNKVLLDTAGSVIGGNTEANTLGFFWGYGNSSEGILADKTMGSEVEAEVDDSKKHYVTENVDVDGYKFVGYFIDEGDCTEPDGDELPVEVNVTADETTTVTFCNQQQEDDDDSEVITRNGGQGGQVLGRTTTTGQVLGDTTQVVAPVGGVAAGNAGSAIGSLYGLGGSLSLLGYGLAGLRKRQ